MSGKYTCEMGGEMHDGIGEIAANHGGKSTPKLISIH